MGVKGLKLRYKVMLLDRPKIPLEQIKGNMITVLINVKLVFCSGLGKNTSVRN